MNIIKKTPLWVKGAFILAAKIFALTFLVSVAWFAFNGVCTMIVDAGYCSPMEALAYPLNYTVSAFFGVIAFVPTLIIGLLIGFLGRKKSNSP
jgi:succinate dehydrogenase/fumarate reductase cytochrome b subunit